MLEPSVCWAEGKNKTLHLRGEENIYGLKTTKRAAISVPPAVRSPRTPEARGFSTGCTTLQSHRCAARTTPQERGSVEPNNRD
jgi:hypothetical protein